MARIIVTNKDFVVAEQVSHISWTPHVFLNQIQFQNWMKQHPYPKPKIIPRRQARGRLLPAIDHRYEIGLDWF